MSLSASQLLSRVQGQASGDARVRAIALLSEDAAESQRVRAVRSRADKTLRLWKLRLKTSQLPTESLVGIRQLVNRLESLPAETEIEQFGLTGSKYAGSIFFDGGSGEFLGDTIVKRRSKSRKMQELEAHLFKPTRKSA
jgi:hypothetical protein